MKRRAVRVSHVRFYRDARGEWRWQLRAPNGRVVATAGEGFTREAKARSNFTLVEAYAPGALETVAP